MTILARLKLRTGETDEALLADIIESAKEAILSRRYPLGEYPTRIVTTEVTETVNGVQTTREVETEETYVEDRYLDLQYRISLDLYNKQGAEGQTAHNENGINRTFESSWISKQLLDEVMPYIGVPK